MAFRKYPDSKQLERELNAGKMENIYLFLGEEEGEKEKIIQKIIEKIFTNEEDRHYSTGRFHMESDELNVAAEFLLSGSMFSNSKVCVILNVNSLKSRGEDARLFGELISTMAESNILIMTSNENKVPPVIDSRNIEIIKIVQFWRFFESDLNNYIIRSVKKSGREIHREAVNLLIDYTGRDIKKIDEALFKVITSGEKLITLDLVKLLIEDNKSISVFEFIDSLFQRDKNIFHFLAKIIGSGMHELAILKLIMRQAELIEKYYSLIKKGFNTDEALREIGISQRNQKNFLNCTTNFSHESIKRIFPLILKADYYLKTHSGTGSLLSNPIFELVTDIQMVQ